jgi:hypothetical protein
MKGFWRKLDMEETQTGEGRNANTTGGRKEGEISKLAFLRDLFETEWGNRPQIVSAVKSPPHRTSFQISIPEHRSGL